MMSLPSSPDFLSHIAAWAQTFPGGGLIFTAVLFLLVLSILIFVHEYGHYFAARSVGIRVNVFAIGFGRHIASWVDKHGTRWQIGWVPLGGYVQMLGQEDGKAYSHENEPDSFGAKSIAQRAWVIAAGPLANLLFGFVLLVLIMLTGEHRMKAEVGQVLPDMPAAHVLQVADDITSVNGQPVADWEDFQAVVSANAGQPLELSILRNGQPFSVSLTPELKTFKDLLGETHHVGRIGIAPSYATFVVRHGPADALTRAAAKTWSITALTVKSLVQLLIGTAPAENLSGPLGIANMAGQTASSGMAALLMFMVVITINLCIVNLFPIPILDGGHLVFLAYEKLVGRPVKEIVQEWMLRIGLACIVSLALFSTFNDVKHLGILKAVIGESAAQPVAQSASTPSATPAP